MFTPLGTFIIAGSFAVLFAVLVLLRYHDYRRHFLLFYFWPLTFPFASFVLDRAKRWREISRWQWVIEGPIVLLALSRAIVSVPLLSGHALFLSYALLSTRSWLAKILAALVMLQVAYLKIWAWGDPGIIGGITLGMGAALMVSRFATAPNRSAA